jgi:ketosteroid isomerase-like protein
VFFPADVASRANGRDEIEAGFRPIFEEGKKRGGGPPYLHIQPKDMEIQMAGDVAIMTFHLERTGAMSRRTIVWQKRGGKWLIVHLHASGVMLPKAAGAQTGVR